MRELASTLPRSHEVLVRDRVKFRVGRIVYLAFSRDEALMGFAFPKEEREALIASEPEKFFETPHYEGHPAVLVRLEAVDVEELTELLTESWMLRAPTRVLAAFEAGRS